MAEVRAAEGWHAHVVEAATKGLERISEAILGDARAAVPVDTGYLKWSLDTELVEGGSGSLPSSRIGSRSAHYSTLIEEGHRVAYRSRKTGQIVYTGQIVPPRPYLRPALLRPRSA